MFQIKPSHQWQNNLPTMYDLPSEDPEEPGLPDEFHALQPNLLSQTLRSPRHPREDCFLATDLNLYFDVKNPRWYKRPDWFLVLDPVRGCEQQDLRWSYVIWQELISPFLVVELLSPGTESEDLGQTVREANAPPTKWEVYEQILEIPYYVVYDRYVNEFRAFHLRGGRYQALALPDGRLWFEELELGLGVWQGRFDGVQGLWLRWYDRHDVWIPSLSERAEEQQQRAEEQQQRAEEQQQRAEVQQQRADRAELDLEQERMRVEEERRKNQELRDRLLKMGIDPDRLS
ncbi:Uma2 family endonuclease [Spirulina sp. 06S082]|uniref:Uma2 family endonuclease n=1 Tax=Spirulina sp. 06S082 TaxID=3110248 RepID=UPI002B2119D1|nr:Uma2 family endonuclease [Spirulina sp. 06S082]MEA5468364.1 Uma2 family endonuclease [Spirulina sp. 06S082]